MTETLILAMAVLLGYTLASRNIKSVSAYVAAYIAALLVGAIISWLASPFTTAVTVISTSEQLGSAAVIDLIGMIAGVFVSSLSVKIESAMK